MSTGIVSQLPSSHLFIHRVPTKLNYGVVPQGVNSAGYSSCFYWLLPTGLGLDRAEMISRRIPTIPSIGFVTDERISALHRFRVSFQNPARHMKYSICPARLWIDHSFCFRFPYAAVFCCKAGYLISFNNLAESYFTPVVSILYITRRILHAITISDCIFFNGFSALVV